VEVKKNRVALHLKKKDKWAHWYELVSKKTAAAGGKAGAGGGAGGAAAAEDPSAGIMDLMKQMYEDGDDNTRRVIAEAWTKSRQQQASGKPSMPAGLGGDLGLDNDLDI
jgi:calcyclin binding protein